MARIRVKSGVTTLGRFEWVPKDQIEIPEEYQREQNTPQQRSKILKIAKLFDWSMFGVLTVAKRKDGALMVADGAGRLGAANERDDVVVVPCMLFDIATVADEAKVFIGTNTDRKGVASAAIFKAKLVANRPEAILVDELVKSCGRRIDIHSSKHTVACTSRMLKFAETDPTMLRAMWPLVVKLYDGLAIPDHALAALCYIERWMKSGSLADPYWKKRLFTLGGAQITKVAKRAAEYNAGGGSTVWAAAIVKALNKGRSPERTGYLVLKEPSREYLSGDARAKQ